MHPAKFLNTDWVDIKELRKFIKLQSPKVPQSVASTGGGSSYRQSSPDTNLVHVKPDPNMCFLPNLTIPIKKEDVDRSQHVVMLWLKLGKLERVLEE